jgi:hypothetical protein
VSDNFDHYKSMYQDLQNDLTTSQRSNEFVKNNTLLSVLNKLEWLKENGGSIDHAIEAIKAMRK